jgi:hypothetical protein
MTKFRLVLVFSSLLLLLLANSPVFANGAKADLSASGKGVLNADCTANIATDPACFEFSQTSSTEAVWQAFSASAPPPTFSLLGPFDLFLVNGITNGTQVTLTLASATGSFGSFLCGDDPTMTTQISGFCADPANLFLGDPSGIFSQDPPNTDASNQATFIFNGTAPATWVFYGSPGATISVSNGSTSASEPGTLLLLAAGVGLLAIAKFRRA